MRVFVEAQAITRFRVNFHREDGCRGDQLVHGYLKLTNTGGAWREWQQWRPWKKIWGG